MLNVPERIADLFTTERFFIANDQVRQGTPSALFPTGMTIGGHILRPPVVLYDSREEAEEALYGPKTTRPTA